MRSVELFTGTGGLALGVAKAGFVHDLLVDRDTHACATLRDNIHRVPEMAEWNVTEADIAQVDFRPHAGFIDLLAAGAPRQPFSLGGRHHGDADSRNMFPEVFSAVRELQPRAVIIENVRGLLRPGFKPYFDYIISQLSLPTREPRDGESWEAHSARIGRARPGRDELRYRVEFQLVNAADFGVPQRRDRVFIVGFRDDLDVDWDHLRPTHSRDALLYAQYVDGSYWREREMADQPVPVQLEKKVAALVKKARPAEWRWRTVRDELRGLPTPVSYVEDALFPNHVGNPGARSYVGHTGSPWDEPAKTLKAGVHGVPGGENTVRGDGKAVRYFTVREAARLQTFPDLYRFSGPWSECMRQLGNAVPVRMAEQFAKRVRSRLDVALGLPSARQRPSSPSQVRRGNYVLLSPRARYKTTA